MAPTLKYFIRNILFEGRNTSDTTGSEAQHDEVTDLPPTHFLVLILLTSLSLIGFTTATCCKLFNSDQVACGQSTM
eukprot:scaffold64264_cov60-Cyclotella_meneghiniana.AAC.1